MLKLLLALRNRKASRGFTLIELLVVVAIIGLLAAFAVPKLFEAINKSKGAQGAADIKTISAALERYYFDNNKYPTSATAAAFKTDLGPYLKKATTFANGFDKGFFYGTDSTGTGGYVLIDPQNSAGPHNAICGSAVNWTVGSAVVVNSTLTKAQIDGCTVPTGTILDTN